MHLEEGFIISQQKFIKKCSVLSQNGNQKYFAQLAKVFWSKYKILFPKSILVKIQNTPSKKYFIKIQNTFLSRKKVF